MSVIGASRPAFFRLGWLLKKLAGSPRAISAARLGKEYGASAKSIYRDVDILRNMGCNIVAVDDPYRPGFAIGFKVGEAAICPLCHSSLSPASGEIKAASLPPHSITSEQHNKYPGGRW